MLDQLPKLVCWFDPFLFTYNALMLIAAVLVPLFLAWSYVRTMREEKVRRLTRELEGVPGSSEEEIRERLSREFRLKNYVGGVLATMVVTAFGAGIMLLMKPVALGLDATDFPIVDGKWCSGWAAQGVDFGRGASFLVLGPFIKDIGNTNLDSNLLIALTAFQFGFLGAWIYFITEASRSYFMCDLTSNTFVNGAIRMITASLLALVLSFIMPLFVPQGAEDGWLYRALPVISFFFGYFPSRALLAIEKFAARSLGGLVVTTAERSTSLSELSGVSYLHEVRLRREGLDNVENLAVADPRDLALRTGYGYRQLKQWVDEAWLRTHLGEDYDTFERATGITSRQELRSFLAGSAAAGQSSAPHDQLKMVLEPKLCAKVGVISVNA